VLALDPQTASLQLDEVLDNFQGRHRNLLASFDARASDMDDVFAAHAAFSRTQKQLVGAYFLHEYSFEAAALFNPSIVAHPDQSGVASGALRINLMMHAWLQSPMCSRTSWARRRIASMSPSIRRRTSAST
jgi:hypothetical protein